MSCVTTLQQLITLESLTPNDAGCMDVIQSILEPFGFRFLYIDKDGTRNMYAEVGDGDFNFCFAGHTDVVPVGDQNSWMYPPFSGTVADGKIYGRGTCDMKGAIAAFITAITQLESMPKQHKISLLLTSDEEGDATNGIKYALPILEQRGFLPTLCLVGEPTIVHDKPFIKIGRRGSFNAKITIKGIMGHVAYPESAKNPHEPLSVLLERLIAYSFDEGTDHFAPTNLEITNVNSFNFATNIIPEKVEIRFNIRFNTLHTKESLNNFLTTIIQNVDTHIPGFIWETVISCDSNADICEDPHLIKTIQNAVKTVLNEDAPCTTFGATSDARFIQRFCPVVEFGLVTHQAHQIDEHVTVKDLDNLTQIYRLILERVVPN